MEKYKWYSTLLIGLGLLLASSDFERQFIEYVIVIKDTVREVTLGRKYHSTGLATRQGNKCLKCYYVGNIWALCCLSRSYATPWLRFNGSYCYICPPEFTGVFDMYT